MKLLIGSLLIPVLVAGCGMTAKVPKYVREKFEGRSGAPPEAEWNREGVWQMKSSNPVVYVPVGYAGPIKRSVGDLIVDRRDGKSFFIPRESVPGMSYGTLRGDAIKKANWSKSQDVQTPAWFK